MQEDMFSLVDVISLIFYKFSDGSSLGPFFGQIEQFASGFEVNFPRVEDAPGNWGAEY